MKRNLMNGTSACTTTFVTEPKHIRDPEWRKLAFGVDKPARSFRGLQPRYDDDATLIRWQDFPQVVLR